MAFTAEEREDLERFARDHGKALLQACGGKPAGYSPPREGRKNDNVNSPSHYTTGGIECFDAMRAMLTGEEMIGYLRGNSFKYRWRFRHKGGAEDLKKAEWYERKLLEIIDVSA